MVHSIRPSRVAPAFLFCSTIALQACGGEDELAIGVSRQPLSEGPFCGSFPNNVKSKCSGQTALPRLSGVTPAVTKRLLLMGGGNKSVAAVRAFLAAANGGDVVVLGENATAGWDVYNSDWYSIAQQAPAIPLNSITTFIVGATTDAGNANLLTALDNAEAVFIQGGDQARYVSLWKGRALVSRLNTRAATIPVGGTSAGLAVAGALYYSAANGSVYTNEILKNPYDTHVTLGYNDFFNFPYMSMVLTESHTSQRDYYFSPSGHNCNDLNGNPGTVCGRQGRLFGFLARAIKDQGYAPTTLKGLAVDEDAAVFVDAAGVGTVYSYTANRSARFMMPQTVPTTVVSGTPIKWNGTANDAVMSYTITATAAEVPATTTWNFSTWAPSSGTPQFFYTLTSGASTTGDAIRVQ